MADVGTQRPLSWDEVATRDPMPGGAPPSAVPATVLTKYVSAGTGSKPEPHVTVTEIPGAGDRAFWRIDVDLGEDVHPFLPGGAATAIDIEALPPGGPLDAHRPDEIAGTWLPGVEQISHDKLLAPDGRKFTPLFIYPPDERQVLTDTAWPWVLV